MDDLKISPEELAQIVMGGDAAAPASLPAIATVPASPAPAVSRQPAQPPVTARPAQFSPLSTNGSVAATTNLDLLLGVTLRVAVELGRTKMTIEEILKLGPGSVVELDKLAGEPVDVLVNDRLIARGEVVVIDDRFGVRITDVIPPVQRVASF
jgi:flagellar motor switch protein FliN/FliY